MNNLTKTKLGGGKTFKRFLALFLILLGCATTGAWAQTPEVTLDFTTNTWELPTSSTKNTATYTSGGYTIQLYAPSSGGYYFHDSNKHLMLGKSGATLTLPAFDFDVEKIVVTGKGGASPNTKLNFFVGNEPASTETTGSAGTNTYVIKDGNQAAGNVYTYKVTSSHNAKITKIEIYKAATSVTKGVKSVAISGTPTTTTYMVGDAPSADGLTIDVTYDDESTGTLASTNSKLAWTFDPVSFDAAGTTHVTATVVYDNNESLKASTGFDVTVEKSIANTEETAYTVEEAVALIDKINDNDKLAGYEVFVKGIISEVGTFNSKYGSLTYYISTDGTTANQFMCYSGLNIGGVKFTAASDVEVGASVIVKGKLKDYNGTKELDTNNELVSYIVKAAESITISGSATKTEYLAGEVPSAEGFTVTANYSDATSKDVTAQVTWTFNPETLAEGTTTVTATATYNGLTATTNFTATAKAVTQLIFDKTKGAFDKLSSYSSSNTTMNAVTLVDINGASLNGFTTNGGKRATTNGCLQLKATSGKLTSPEFSDFTYGYTVKVTYYPGATTKAPTLQSGELSTQDYKTEGTANESNGTGYYIELTVPTGAAFTLTAGNAMYIGRIEITKNDAPEPTTATITLNAACTDGEMVYGTFSSSKAFKVSNDIIVSEIMVENGKLVVTNYASGAIVPANTGVMVSAMGGGDYTVELSDEEGTSVLGTDNMLKPGSEAMSGDCKFYRLTMHGGKTLGFFWGAAEGAAFSIAADKAYLAVPTTMAANIQGFTFSDTETGINGINAAEGKQAIYNLQGQRVSRAVKGIYIVNGKKVIIK